MQNILIGLTIAALVVVLLAMALRPTLGPSRFVDADKDGEPDETPAEKRRALEVIRADHDDD